MLVAAPSRAADGRARGPVAARPAAGARPAGRRPDRRSLPAAGGALRVREPRARVRHDPGRRRAGQRGRHGGVRRPGGGRTARHGAPRRRRAHELLVPATRCVRPSAPAWRPGDAVGNRRRAPALRRPGGRRLLRSCRPLQRHGDGRAAAVRGAPRIDARRRGPCLGGCRARPTAAGCPSATSARRSGGSATGSSTGPRCSQAVPGSPAPARSGAACPSPPTSSIGWCSPRRAPSDPPPVRPLAGERRVAVTVAGLGSTSESAAIDDLRTADLGYDPEQGGALQLRRRAHAAARGPPWLPSRPPATRRPTPRATWSAPAARLADLVEQVAEADPGARVDLYAHSLGGLVTRLALVELQRRGFALSRLGLVATIASPHRGADLATAVAVAADAPSGRPGVWTWRPTCSASGSTPMRPVVAQLSEQSERGRRGWPPPACPRASRLLSIAARGDLVVASPHTQVDGAVNVTVPVAGLSAHSAVVGSDGATPRSPGRSPVGRRAARRGTTSSPTSSPVTPSPPSRTSSASSCGQPGDAGGRRAGGAGRRRRCR